ncbi:TPA: insulinase family protein [Candidatus Woesearchaeota archaeon]|nr:insulinase family protein [Candidatus Woesearchaeota archaeon]
MLIKKILPNGLRILFEKKETDSVTILVAVHVGSNFESAPERGISHFIEHMLFEGTTTRPTNAVIANEIESLGGDFNAYTANERTVYYIRVPKKHFRTALNLLSDMIQNSVLDKQMLEKERAVILKEINMVIDDPRFYQWILFHHALFEKHPAQYPIYGSVKTMKSITREMMLDFYRRWYVAGNMTVAVVGDVHEPIAAIASLFSSMKKSSCTLQVFREPNRTKKKTVVKQKKILNAYLVMGYKTVARMHPDSYVLDVIKSLLARGQSGTVVEEIRGKRGLAYEVGVLHDPHSDYGVFAAYLNTEKKNIPPSLRLIMQSLASLRSVSAKELTDAKGFLMGRHILEHEDTHSLADELCEWELWGSAKDAHTYLAKIRKVSASDVARVAKRYFTGNYTIARVERK